MTEFLTSIIGHLAGGSGPGPRQAAITRCALSVLLEIPNTGFRHLVPLLIDPEWRQVHLPLAHDEEAKAFLSLQLDAQSRSEAFATALPVVNAISPIITNPYFQRLLDAEPQLDLSHILRNDECVVVNASEAQIGGASGLLTGVMTALIQQTAAARLADPPSIKRDYFYAVDEAHRAGDILVKALGESREAGLKLILATQMLHAFSPEVRSALDANASWAVLRTGLEDARLVAEKFGYPVTADDIMRQENYRATVRIAMPGWMPPPFTLWTDPPLEAPPEAELPAEPVESFVGLKPVETIVVPARAMGNGRRRPDVDEG
jgi:hypothetical protein